MKIEKEKEKGWLRFLNKDLCCFAGFSRYTQFLRSEEKGHKYKIRIKVTIFSTLSVNALG